MLCASQSWVAHAFASCIRAGDLLEYVCSTLAVTVSVVVTSGIPGGLGGTSGADGGCVGSWLSRSLAVAVFGSGLSGGVLGALDIVWLRVFFFFQI